MGPHFDLRMMVSFHICLAPTNRFLLSFTLLSPFKLSDCVPLFHCEIPIKLEWRPRTSSIAIFEWWSISKFACAAKKGNYEHYRTLLLVLKVERHPHKASKFPCLREQSILKIPWFVKVSGRKLLVCLMYTKKKLDVLVALIKRYSCLRGQALIPSVIRAVLAQRSSLAGKIALLNENLFKFQTGRVRRHEDHNLYSSQYSMSTQTAFVSTSRLCLP